MESYFYITSMCENHSEKYSVHAHMRQASYYMLRDITFILQYVAPMTTVNH